MLVTIPSKVEMWIEFFCPFDHHHQAEGLVSLHGLGAAVRCEIHIAIRPLEDKLASVHTVFNTRMDSMEGALSNMIQIEKLGGGNTRPQMWRKLW